MFKNNKFMQVVCFLMGTGFLILAVFFTFNLANNLLMGYQSQSWGSITGKITNVSISTSIGGKYPSFTPHVNYEYTVEKNIYTGDTIAFKPITNSQKDATNIVAKYSSGGQVRVFYNPSLPNISCLEPGFFVWEYSLNLPLIILLGVIGIWFNSILFPNILPKFFRN